VSIEGLLREGESERVEFKTNLREEREILETICSFLNSKGGVILVGVDDFGRPVGLEIGRKSLEGLVSRKGTR